MASFWEKQGKVLKCPLVTVMASDIVFWVIGKEGLKDPC